MVLKLFSAIRINLMRLRLSLAWIYLAIEWLGHTQPFDHLRSSNIQISILFSSSLSHNRKYLRKSLLLFSFLMLYLIFNYLHLTFQIVYFHLNCVDQLSFLNFLNSFLSLKIISIDQLGLARLFYHFHHFIQYFLIYFFIDFIFSIILNWENPL